MADRKSTFAGEVSDRLGEFFGNTDKADAPARDANPSPQKEPELLDLKAIVLSIEWEITDEIMARLIAETGRLIKIYSDNRVVLSLLKLLDSVGKYVNAKKATAHPESIRLLHSIHANLQKVVTSETITESQSGQILSAEIEKFKHLKQQLLTKAKPLPLKEINAAAATKTAPVEHPQHPAQLKEVSAAAPAGVAKDPVLQAVDELKKLIQEEFKLLRDELRQLRR